MLYRISPKRKKVDILFLSLGSKAKKQRIKKKVMMKKTSLALRLQDKKYRLATSQSRSAAGRGHFLH